MVRRRRASRTLVSPWRGSLDGRSVIGVGPQYEGKIRRLSTGQWFELAVVWAGDEGRPSSASDAHSVDVQPLIDEILGGLVDAAIAGGVEFGDPERVESALPLLGEGWGFRCCRFKLHYRSFIFANIRDGPRDYTPRLFLRLQQVQFPQCCNESLGGSL